MLELKNDIKLGFKYAFIFLVVSAFMGFLYGLLGLTIFSTMLFSISIVGIFVILNFPFALISIVINLFFMPFSKSSKRITRYFIYSFTFLIVFMTYFLVFKLSGVEPF